MELDDPLPLKDKLWLYLWHYPRFYWLEKRICVALKINLEDYLGPLCQCGHRCRDHYFPENQDICNKCVCNNFIT